jgi:hypothetical protein
MSSGDAVRTVRLRRVSVTGCQNSIQSVTSRLQRIILGMGVQLHRERCVRVQLDVAHPGSLHRVASRDSVRLADLIAHHVRERTAAQHQPLGSPAGLGSLQHRHQHPQTAGPDLT